MKRIAVAVAVVGALLVAVGGTLWVANAAPVVPALSAADVADVTRPYVVKLHAQWCSKCMTTKDMWSQIEAAYGSRVKFVVFDFTTQETTDRSRAEADRLGLRPFFDEFEGVSGSVAVLDGRTRTLSTEIYASRDFAEYQTAIDAALAAR
jgi:thiol-disulfide isomerase/thioredoxin